MNATPIAELIDANAGGGMAGWNGPGWYWNDPAWRARPELGRRVQGPYPAMEEAVAAYWDYCAAMTA